MNGRTIVFIHGMYMNSLCWEHWLPFFEGAGYRCLAPDWPGRDQAPYTLREKHPDPRLGELTLSAVLGHYEQNIQRLDEKPVLIGHSMGGLAVQLLLQRGLGAAGVAIDSAPPFGVLSLKWPFLKSNWPHITPFVSVGSPIEMSFERFQYTFVNTLPLAEQQAAFDRYVVPESRRVPRQSLTARIDFRKPHPPLLLIAGSADHLIPASLNKLNFSRYREAASLTDFKVFEARTHFIIGQSGWQEVAGAILTWLENKVYRAGIPAA